MWPVGMGAAEGPATEAGEGVATPAVGTLLVCFGVAFSALCGYSEYI